LPSIHGTAPDRKALIAKRKSMRENRKKRRRISEAVCTQSQKACYEAIIQSEAKPTLQEEKEQAQERELDRKRESKQ
jgi:hypothetical protein